MFIFTNNNTPGAQYSSCSSQAGIKMSLVNGQAPLPKVGSLIPIAYITMKKKNNTTLYQIFKMSLFNISLFTLALALSCSSGDSQSNEAPSDFVVEVAT